MDLPREWFEAIKIRHSRRAYDGRKPSPEVMDRLRGFCSEFRPYAEARAVLVESPSHDIFKGLVGGYGQVRGARCYIAFVGRMDSPFVQERVGYLGEAVILQATSQGLDTCWVGAFFRPEVAARDIGAREGEQVLAVTPVGSAVSGASTEEKMLKGLARSHSRRPLNDLVTGLSPGEWPFWVKQGLEAARLAPSAVNRQPWRFHVQKHSITVRVDDLKNSYHIHKRLDCGIAMLHLELGAQSAGVKGQWTFLEPPMVASYTIS